MADDELVTKILLDRFDRIEASIQDNHKTTDFRLRAVEARVNWALGLATALGSMVTLFGQKIYSFFFG